MTTISVFLDHSKSSDTLDHTILPKILKYGIRRLAWGWFMNYWKDKTQFESYKAIKSVPRDVTH